MISETFFESCCRRNRTLDRCHKAPDRLLSDFIRLQEEKVTGNCTIHSLVSPEDFYERAAEEAVRLTGEAEAAEVAEALKLKALQTADHHGGLFFSQGFQGDMMFAFLLRNLGYRGRYVPVLCAGQVELENASFARGIMAVESPDEKQLFPVFPAKNSVMLASEAEHVGLDLTNRFRKRFLGKDSLLPPDLMRALDRIVNLMYEVGEKAGPDTEHPEGQYRFSDQITGAGVRLSRELFSGDGPLFVYLEMEGLLTPVLIRELKEGRSLFARLMSGDVLKNLLVQEKLPDGRRLADVLFRAVDEKGRKIILSLEDNGKLTGLDWRKQTVTFDTDPGTLISLLEDRKILPGVFTLVCLLFFERGITWLGGIFQSCYLPEWQDCLVRILRKAGEEEMATHISDYDCSGYLSGPAYCLYRGEGFAVPAGPVEFWQVKPSFSRVTDLISRTRLSDAHLMGLSDIYLDLFVREEREENWYRKLAEELYRRFPENGVSR